MCNKLGLFEYEQKGYDYVVSEVSDNEGWKKIRDNLVNDTGINGLPYIRVKGRKGGSTVAAAIVNALMYNVVER